MQTQKISYKRHGFPPQIIAHVALLSGERLECTLTGRRSYDRQVGSCRLGDGRDIAAIMISEGACRRWR